MFAKLNAVAKNQKILKKISELTVGQCYVIDAVRKVVTKYGEKVIVELENNIICYLPARVSKELLANNETALIDFQAQLNEGSISLRRLDGGNYNPIEFLVTPADSSSDSD